VFLLSFTLKNNSQETVAKPKIRRKMSYKVTEYVLNSDLRKLSAREICVLHCLAFHAQKDGTYAYPSMQTIATQSGLKNRQVAQRYIRRLQKKGIIEKTGETSGQFSTGIYRFLMAGANKAIDGVQPPAVAGTEPQGATVEHLRCNRTDHRGATASEGWRNRGVLEVQPPAVAQKVLKVFKREEKGSKGQMPRPLASIENPGGNQSIGDEPLQEILSWIAKHTDCRVPLSRKQIPEIRRLVGLYGKLDFKAGFDKFWENFLESKPQKTAYAAADFVETGEQFVLYARRSRIDRETERSQMEQEIEQIRTREARERAEREAREAEEVPDPLFDELRGISKPEQKVAVNG
jgi:hypothetical protein